MDRIDPRSKLVEEITNKQIRQDGDKSVKQNTKTVKESIKGPILFIIGAIYGMLMTMMALGFLPIWLSALVAIAITIAAICIDD